MKYTCWFGLMIMNIVIVDILNMEGLTRIVFYVASWLLFWPLIVRFFEDKPNL